MSTILGSSCVPVIPPLQGGGPTDSLVTLLGKQRKAVSSCNMFSIHLNFLPGGKSPLHGAGASFLG